MKQRLSDFKYWLKDNWYYLIIFYNLGIYTAIIYVYFNISGNLPLRDLIFIGIANSYFLMKWNERDR